MKVLNLTAIVVMSLAVPSVLQAQEVDDNEEQNRSNPIKIERPDNEVKEIVVKAKMHESPAEVHAPALVVHSANNNFVATIGGEVNPILGYDIGNNLYKQPGAGISFVTSQIPVPAQSGKKGDFYINPLNGFLDLTIVGLAGTDNEITAYVKAGTNGINSSVLLQRAYLSYRRFTAGMKLTLAQDAYACQPPTIDPEGPSGCLSAVAYEIGYTSRSYSGFRFAAAIDMPTFYSSNGVYRGKDHPDFDGSAAYGNAEQYIPDVPAWVEYSSSQWNRVRFTALLRNFAYRNLVTNKTSHKVGWGVMLSGNVQPVRPVILYYQAVYGRGIGSYLQDIAGHPLSFVPDDERPGKVQASPMMGLNFGVTVNATSKLQFNAMVSESRIWDVDDYARSLPTADNYRYALYAAANCFYNITPYLQWGIEYLWGRRSTYGMGHAHDSRIQTQLAFTF